MLYDFYDCKTEDIFEKENEKTYEIPNHDGARISKLAPKGKLLRSQYEDLTTLIEMINRGSRLSNNGPCLGWRSSKSEYTWINYKEFLNRAINFGSGLISLGIELGQSSRVCIYAKNSIEWQVTHYGCLHYSAVIVPLYDSIGFTELSYMTNHVETPVVICDEEKKVKTMLDKKEDLPYLKHIIHIKEISEEIKKLAEVKGIKLHLFTDIEEMGKTAPVKTNEPKAEDVAIISYTSGSTGVPKGVILTHSNIISAICGLKTMLGDIVIDKNDVLISYLPLAHVYEQISNAYMFMCGACIGFYSGDASLLTDDMKVLKPTIFPTVPRVLNKLYDKIISQINMMKLSLKEKVHSEEKKSEIANRTNGRNDEYSNSLAHKALAESLGGRVKLIISGSAPIAEKVLKFIQTALHCEVLESYGMTESCGPSCTMIITSKNHVSGLGLIPNVCNMIKLKDVPEKDYLKEMNIGEICIRGPNVFKGYFKDSKKTSEVFDEDGWLCSGDIGKWLPDGTFKIIDRKKDLFKLAQGEYIVPEKIESICSGSAYVSQILVYGDSLQSCLVAIIVPDQDETMPWCKKQSLSGDWADICKNSLLKKHILEDMQRVSKQAGLFTFQQVKDIYLHPEPFTVENGFLTPTQKMRRYLIQKTFKEKLQSMYDQM